MRFVFAFLAVSLMVMPCMAAEDNEATQRAIVQYRLENYEEALQILTQLRERTPLSDYYTGLCQKETGNYGDAVGNFTSAVRAKPPVKDAALDLVWALNTLDRPDQALEWVAWAEKEQVKPHEIAFLKGQLLVKKQRYDEALVAFNDARTGAPETDQQVDLQIAIVYALQGKNKEASQSLKAIVTRYPGTDAAQFASEYDQRITEAAAARKWHLFAGVNYFYDDNASAVPVARSATTAPGNEKNSGFNESLRFEYDTSLGGRWAGNLQYSLQNSNYTRLHEFNTLAHGLTLTAIHRDDILLTSLPVNISQSTLDYNNYSLQVSFRPTATILFSPQHLGQVTAGYTRREMYQNAPGPQNNRDADIYNGQASYVFLFDEGQGMLNLRYELFYEDTAGNEWRNLGNRLGMDGLVPLSTRTKLIFSLEGTWQDYHDSVEGRKDTIFIGSATVNQHLMSNLYFNLQYSYTRALSNVDLYDYQRNVVATGFELRF
ncbi:MAG TPA: tetratricopeptide repeat protein [Desulfuromonadaceae bacterium]